MNILFLTLVDIKDIAEHNIYSDLLREFSDNHKVYLVSPTEQRYGEKTGFFHTRFGDVLRVRTGNIQHTASLIEKGWSTVRLESQYIQAVREYLADVRFDLVMYSTPPITLAGVAAYVKQRDGARTYLLLKDIFPQNAVDIGMMKKNGLRGLLYRYFRRKEKNLYKLSDYIGCMSLANKDYILAHNPELDAERVEICPNSVDIRDMSVAESEKKLWRAKYGIPVDKTIFIYGGNLGKPQGIPFLIDCLRESARRVPEAFFLIVGGGTEYRWIEEYIQGEQPENCRLLSRLPKDDYDAMAGSCDVGLIFLDHRFTIPNFPSRLLSYMEAKMPVLAATDPHTDLGQIIEQGAFGWWCESNSTVAFVQKLREACQADRRMLGDNAWQYLNEHYSVKQGYQIIMEKLG